MIYSIKKNIKQLMPLSSYSRLTSSLMAKKYSKGAKRLDLCASQIAYAFHMSEFKDTHPLKDKVCLEIGSGWLLSHSLIFYLLGAKKVISTDYIKLAHPKFLYNAINNSELSIIRDILSPFEEHYLIRERLNKLSKIKKFTFDLLCEEFGVEYIAPIDISKELIGENIDFSFSGSVLEHVPGDDIIYLLNNLSKQLKAEGKMIHFIHLEDHKDLDNPFAFLSIPKEEYNKNMQLERGNRIRKSQWVTIFSKIENTKFKIFHEWKRMDKELPQIIDKSIHHVNRDDLITSHLGVIFNKI